MKRMITWCIFTACLAPTLLAEARYYDPDTGRFLQEDEIPPYFDPINETNLYLYTGNNPVSRIDPLGLWYVDINVSGGWWGLGGTGGILIGEEGIYTYEGGGVVSPGIGGSITWSPQDPSTGWNVGVQGSAGLSGQYGYSFKDKGKFWEVGAGASYPTLGGGSLTGYYVHDPWKWPWIREQPGKQKEKLCEDGNQDD